MYGHNLKGKPMTLRENFMLVLEKHGKGEHIPAYSKPVRFNTGLLDPFEKGPVGGGKDGFGCLWATDATGQVPVPGHPVITDITRWKEQVQFPELFSIDWEKKAEKELAPLDRKNQVLQYCMGNGPFERLLDLMGMEELVYAMVDDEDSVKDFYKAYQEYRLTYLDYIIKYYKPDIVEVFDDVGYMTGMFLTKAQYEEFISPVHKEFNTAVRNAGALPVQHCCGRAETLIEDFIEEGAAAWSSVEPRNDIVGMLKKYGDKITLIGGFNTQGKCASLDATDEEMISELHRAMDTYGPYGSFIMGNHVVSGYTPEESLRRRNLLAEEAVAYGMNYYERTAGHIRPRFREVL